MGKFLTGIATSGAWACFDEFNRIDIEVLSVVAQQLRTMFNAKKATVDRFVFEGENIAMIPSFHIAVTMNPGYSGRSELPDNLKEICRPIAMMVRSPLEELCLTLPQAPILTITATLTQVRSRSRSSASPYPTPQP